MIISEYYKDMIIYTIGHSTHPIDEFIEMLKARKIEQLVDVRTIPKSRYNPQFEQEALKKSLSEASIRYVYIQDLGGLRPAVKESTNLGWRNQSFRNYADYMQTEQFKNAVEELINISKDLTTAIMCAEAVPWRCHRSLVGDALLIRGVRVVDIMSLKNEKDHKLTSFAEINGTDITYPKETEEN